MFSLPPAVGWTLFLITEALAIWAIVHVLRQRKEPMAMLAWILGVLLLPVAGVSLYWLIGERRIRRKARRKRRRTAPIVAAIANADAAASREEEAEAARRHAIPGLEESLRELAGISEKLGTSPLTSGNRVETYLTAQETYDNILEAIEGARHHVHLEYYIFRPDDTGRMFLDRLVERARAGVEVRVLLDGVGSWGTSTRFFQPLLAAGGKVETFLPAIPWRRTWHINCRNHRKLVVVDSEVAFTGSQNVGDEYRGLLRRLGPWKDTHLKLEGPAVREIQEVFVEDWYYAAQENLTDERYLRKQPVKGTSLVQIVPTGPDQDHPVLAHVFFAALALARRSICISTPYFVPDPGLILALQHAAYRGIQVDILIPSRTDSKVVLWAGRSYYPDLLAAGARIHEFPHGMLHSKVVIIDDGWNLVGSANMDVRSFLLNFEVTSLIFDREISRKLEQDFRADVARSKRIRPREAPARLGSALLEGTARILSPLL